MGEIKDLSLLLGEPIQARFAADGPVYKFPADCPTELYLLLIRSGQIDQDTVTDDEELELTRELRDGILELFQVHQPNLKRLPAAISLPVLVKLIGQLYQADSEDPTPPQAEEPASTQKPKPKPRRKAAAATSRSSASSGS